MPIILSSDRTEITTFAGKQSCYPVYMTIGNIPKHLRRKPSFRAQRLLAYLPTGKIEGTDFSDAILRKLRAQLFHTCMETVCAPMFGPAADGMDFTDSAGTLYRFHTVLAAYVADYPEQCLVTCVRYGRACPVCDVLVDEFGDDVCGETRQQGDTLLTIQTASALPSKEGKAMLTAAGLNDRRNPFWAHWPHANIHAAMSSDVLHQLIQGVGKHLVEWMLALVPDERELDARFQRLPYATGVRHFRHGISKLSNVTGSEHKAIYAQLLACIQGIVPINAIRAATTLLDFIYIAQFECHSETTLASLTIALSNFHEYLPVFLRPGVRSGACSCTSELRQLINPADFKLPKLHAMQHYVSSIRRFGTVDNYNTEATERLHIDLAKNAFRATNKRDYGTQMCRWLRRREAVLRFHSYLSWIRGEPLEPQARHETHASIAHPPVIVAKRPHHTHVSLEQLRVEYKATHFVRAMDVFLRRWHQLPHGPGWDTALDTRRTFALRTISTVRVWNHVKFLTPNVETVVSTDSRSTAYASAARGHFDPVLVRITGEDIVGVGGLEGTP